MFDQFLYLEMLLNLLHNIGALLRKDSPSLCKDIILLNEAKKVELKVNQSSTSKFYNVIY